jgi:hypothetical protein
MEPADRMRRTVDEVHVLLQESKALLRDFRKTIEESRRVLEESYRILDKAKRPSGAIENALKKTRVFSKMIFIPCLINSQELFIRSI